MLPAQEASSGSRDNNKLHSAGSLTTAAKQSHFRNTDAQHIIYCTRTINAVEWAVYAHLAGRQCMCLMHLGKVVNVPRD